MTIARSISFSRATASAIASSSALLAETAAGAPELQQWPCRSNPSVLMVSAPSVQSGAVALMSLSVRAAWPMRCWRSGMRGLALARHVDADVVAVDARSRSPENCLRPSIGSARLIRASWPFQSSIVREPGQRPVDAGRADLEPVGLLDRVAPSASSASSMSESRRDSARNRRASAGACRAARPSPAASDRTCRRSSRRARARAPRLAPRARSAWSVRRCPPCALHENKALRRRPRPRDQPQRLTMSRKVGAI